jgi:hypothetical protein
MKFSSEELKKIEQLGSNGYSIFRISKELNMTFTELEDEMEVNPYLKTAIDRASRCYEAYMADEYEKRSFNVKSPIQAEAYKRIKEKDNKNNDNEIVVRRVDGTATDR